MKSTKRKTIKKQNVLIALDKGIASVQSIELAMLFSHAGFDVRTILTNGAEEYVSTSVLKEVTTHSPWSESYKPGWLKTDLNFIAGILIATENIPEVLADSTPADATNEKTKTNNQFFEYFLSHCQSLTIITSETLAENIKKVSENQQIIALPQNLLKLREIFERVLAASVKFSSSKILQTGLSYSIEGDFNKINYINNFISSFADYGITYKPVNNISQSTNETESPENNYQPAKMIITNSSKQIEVMLEEQELKKTTPTLIYLNTHRNGLLLTDRFGTRLLPDFSSKSCFSRFVEYLMVELTRE